MTQNNPLPTKYCMWHKPQLPRAAPLAVDSVRPKSHQQVVSVTHPLSKTAAPELQSSKAGHVGEGQHTAERESVFGHILLASNPRGGASGSRTKTQGKEVGDSLVCEVSVMQAGGGLHSIHKPW